MEFPKDHNWHKDYPIEWIYLWGKIGSKFFHMAEFCKRGSRFMHCSFDGNFVEKELNEPQLTIFPEGKIIVHPSKRNYYSMIGKDFWLDHEWGNEVGSDWDWVGAKLDCGINIMGYSRPGEKVCSVSMNGEVIDTDFILDGKHFFIYKTGMYLTLEPLKEEIIFRPKFGRPYSETPFEVISKGGVIGIGMRERTYKEN